MAAIQDGGAPITSSTLLQKLKKGQQDLRKSFKSLKNSKQESEEGQRLAVRTRRQLLERPLNAVKDLPRKRARLELLSPGIESKGTRKHPRRFSSTPKKCDKPLTHSAPAVDLSLEEALLNPSKPPPACGQQQTSIDDPGAQFLPSPKLSRVVVNTSRNVRDSPVENCRHSHGSSKKASRSKSSASKRGLSVSFVGDKEHDNTQKRFLTNQRSIRHASTTRPKEKQVGESLIQSLNVSRHGALDRKLSQQRSFQRFPRKYSGDDPQLGYDWIAGLIDASDSYLNERDDEYFKEMKEFRRVNCSECSKPREAMLPDSLVRTDSVDLTSEGHDEDNGYCGNTSTTCVKSYSLNDRLFPIPQHMNSDLQTESGRGILEECCPVCEDKHTTNRSPVGYIRVSVPRRTLQGPLRARPHRRRSFDPTDSMGLNKHCLTGWETAQPSIIPPQASVGLKAAVEGGTGADNKSQVRSCDLLNTSHSFEYNLRSRSTKRT